jgi:arylsulfatase A
MKRNGVTLAIIGVGLVLLQSCLHGKASAPSETAALPEHPNIIYILADDLGYGDLGCFGQTIIQTPNLDRMAAEGIRFTNHYAGSSVCAPSRAALMTGRHSGRSYVRGNYEVGPHGFGAGLELRDEDITLAEVLKRANYTTGLVGKWGLGVSATTGEPNRQGFDYSYGFLNQAHAHYQFPDYLFRNGKRIEITANRGGKQGAFSNDLFTGEAIGFIERQSRPEAAKQPFFLYLAYTTPHAEMLINDKALMNQYRGKVAEKPFVAGKQGAGKDGFGGYASQQYPASAYAAQVTHLDRCVGKLIAALKKAGLDKNTLVLFSSDNGPHAEGGANPAYFTSSGGLRGQKRDLYEGGIRVPFIARWPAGIKPGQTSAHISAFWDVMPTVAELADVSIDEMPVEGNSFLPTLQGQPAKQTQHNYLYWEFHENPTTNQAIRQGRWKAVRLDPDGPVELYDLMKDPAETRNVADQNPTVVAEMKTMMNTARSPHDLWKLKYAKGK